MQKKKITIQNVILIDLWVIAIMNLYMILFFYSHLELI